MIAPRRFLPSISALLSFEAVVRLGTATAAAQELNLTQSAVSRQIKTLEEQLGVTLMIRQGRRLTPTQAGLDYVTQVRDILNQLAGRIGDDTIGALNLEVDQEDRDPGDVAREFLVNQGLIDG